jgi:hypothetical protein
MSGRMGMRTNWYANIRVLYRLSIYNDVLLIDRSTGSCLIDALCGSH